ASRPGRPRRAVPPPDPRAEPGPQRPAGARSTHRRAVRQERTMSDLLWAAGPRFDRPAHHRPRTFDTMVVSRRVSAGPERITALVGDPSALTTTLPGGGVLAVGPMTASPGIVGTTWNGDGRIGRSGALRRA